jgi:hypothetical protein
MASSGRPRQQIDALTWKLDVRIRGTEKAGCNDKARSLEHVDELRRLQEVAVKRYASAEPFFHLVHAFASVEGDQQKTAPLEISPEIVQDALHLLRWQVNERVKGHDPCQRTGCCVEIPKISHRKGDAGMSEACFGTHGGREIDATHIHSPIMQMPRHVAGTASDVPDGAATVEQSHELIEKRQVKRFALDPYDIRRIVPRNGVVALGNMLLDLQAIASGIIDSSPSYPANGPVSLNGYSHRPTRAL